ncbi:helix-turn-helix domain-containing protein [Paenibacillus alvei]|uniref:Helix-turn-helix domain-containing protein n=1 Tax=Paenibacillus alvei TaxID=44250 RepID=A0ABT4H6J1_PAEAL|nr:helix-turn-helix domain-containing protein [Paenibacillus alvei]EJW14407.1 hypothetical protein PAV_13c00260 [Paenibacillus alvei DSM 29]MCY9539880.1 helix-turn-helix domain-containing protein [Paenibacillus alvei]MCY9708693.1 helix-turn-helix domain-containing protein [Paenibacillus alvei]MCY9737278.1 helix-turn-helix domain-containing protein [Paenibacillus alvei]MCY9758124.1 helix-turn-helix domain-containing protein [Paenibacillus alvei]
MSTDDFLEEIKERVYKEMVDKFKKDVEELYTIRIQRATLNSDQAADYLGICKETLYTLLKEKQIAAIPMGSAKSRKPNYRFRLSSLDKYLDEQERKFINGESA